MHGIAVRLPRPIPRATIENNRLGAVSKRFEQYKRGREAMARNDEKIVDSLLLAGVDLRSDRGICVVDAIVEDSREVDTFRRSQFLASVQSASTRAMKDGLSAYLQANHRNCARMIVVKGGWIQLVNYRRAHLRLARTLSDLSRELKRRFGWILQFANIENKIHCDAISGAQSDQHGHMIVTGPRIGRREIKLLETFVRRFMKSAGYQEYCHVSSIQWRTSSGLSHIHLTSKSAGRSPTYCPRTSSPTSIGKLVVFGSFVLRVVSAISVER